MVWNLFEKIINALKPSNESEQTPDVSQPWPENNTEQNEDSHEPSGEVQQQETAGANQQNEWLD